MFKLVPEHKLLTLTLDNGKEFPAFKTLEQPLDLSIYFADPYCSRKEEQMNIQMANKTIFPQENWFSNYN